MSPLDWGVMLLTLAFITFYGIYKNRNDKNLDAYLLGGQSLPWYHVGLSVMATQASAITFLSAPGQGFTDGMRFVQFYFGLPLAMIVLSVTFIPLFHRLKVYTAYEYLEQRFDSRVRILTAILFLLQRGLSTGISIYAPAIILSTIFGLDIFWTNIIMGGLVLSYTVFGGTKAISYTHVQQMLIMTLALFFTAFFILKLLPDNIGMVKALQLAGKSHKMNVVDFTFNPQDRYNVWSGLIGGFFLQLSYFGTDQSQVGRYLTGRSVSESRIGLLMNGFIKIPMQFSILLIGVLVYVFYQFNPSPLFFNEAAEQHLSQVAATEYRGLQEKHQELWAQKKEFYVRASRELETGSLLPTTQAAIDTLDARLAVTKAGLKELMKRATPQEDTADVNYIFLRFIRDNLPTGLIGLLIAIIFTASMGSIASAYNSLAATTIIDVYSKSAPNFHSNDKFQVKATQYVTVFWSIFCIFVAFYAHKLGASMIELVNVLGSWFYGVILGIFLVAFYLKSVGGKATFIAALIAQLLVILIWWADIVGFLWLNPIGCLLVMGLSFLLQNLFFKAHARPAKNSVN